MSCYNWKDMAITSIENSDFPVKPKSLFEAFIGCNVYRFGMKMPCSGIQLDPILLISLVDLLCVVVGNNFFS